MTVKGKIFLCVAVLAVLFAVAGSVVLGRYYVDNRKANFTSDYVLYVYPDTELDEVVDSLQSGAGTIRPKSLKRAFAKMEVAENIKQIGRAHV